MGTDADLRRRMGATVALLVLADLAFVAVVAAVLAPWLRPVRATFAAAVPLGPLSTAVAWWAVVLLPALAVFVWAQLRYTRRRTLAQVDARTATREEYPDLIDRVHRLAQVADVRPPTVAIAPAATPNSFAVGGLGNATLVVSEGLLDALDGDELDAVLAHELAHVANRDATVMTLASFLPAVTNGEFGLADLGLGDGSRRLAVLGLAALAAALLAGRAIDAPLGSARFLFAYVLLVGLTLLLGAVALGVVTAPVVYVGRSLSRAREFAADRAAAATTGDPAALAGALATLDEEADAAPDTDKRRAYEGVRGLCFLPRGFDGSRVGQDGERSKFYVETRSHPPTEDRIERLRALEADR